MGPVWSFILCCPSLHLRSLPVHPGVVSRVAVLPLLHDLGWDGVCVVHQLETCHICSTLLEFV